jgi:hypothetical protein
LAHGRYQCVTLQPPLGAQFDAPEVLSFEVDAKQDTFSSSLSPLQAGHFTSEISLGLNTRVSNDVPQSRQSNS